MTFLRTSRMSVGASFGIAVVVVVVVGCDAAVSSLPSLRIPPLRDEDREDEEEDEDVLLTPLPLSPPTAADGIARRAAPAAPIRARGNAGMPSLLSEDGVVATRGDSKRVLPPPPFQDPAADPAPASVGSGCLGPVGSPWSLSIVW